MSISMFDNTEIAFRVKSDSELKRAHFLFKMIGSESLVKMGSNLALFSLRVKLPVKGIIRKTVFDHFCGGETEQEALPVVESLYKHGVYSVFDYAIEGKEEEEQFDATTKKIIELTELATKNKAMPFAVFKPTGIGRFKIWQKVSESIRLRPEEEEEWDRIRERYDLICSTAHRLGVTLLIDAEHSWMQDAADDLCEEMMVKYNTERPIVFGTLQCYRWDRLDYLKEQHKRAKEKGYKLGYKIVRGAYLEVENERAKEFSYKSPICATKEETDKMFNDVMRYMLDHIEDIHLYNGTHNEESSYLCTQIMAEKGLANDDKRVWFGQLYGMSDHISFNLAEQGYNTSKYLPFGPIEDVMPYLIRRAEENTSVAGQTGRELMLIERERARRKKAK